MTSQKFNLELVEAKREISKICKKENYLSKIKLEINKCIICNKYPENIFIKKILYKNKKYINYPTYLCQRCGMAQQLFKFDNKFHNYYYKKIISKNLKINSLILNNNFKLSHLRGKFLFNKFKRFFPKRKLNILDLGSGTGGLLKYFKDQGHNVYGIEPNYEYYKFSKKILNNVINKNFEDYNYKKNFFDLVLIIGTLEHVNNVQKTIKMVNKITKKNSLMVVDSKGYPNDVLKNYFNFNHHRCFTKNTLKCFLGQNGWKKKYIEYNNSYGKLKVNHKIYDKKIKLKLNLKGNIIGILGKKLNKIKINFTKDKLFTSLKITKNSTHV
jgi:ubiquinone/menaquinone biosynthesis C-methylase UbiE